MSTWKAAKLAGEKRPANELVSHGTANPPLRHVEVRSLELDVDAEVDCDPYNRTGHFLAADLKKFED